MSFLKRKHTASRSSSGTKTLLKTNFWLSLFVLLLVTFLMQGAWGKAAQLIERAARLLSLQARSTSKRGEDLKEPALGDEAIGGLRNESPPLTIGVKRLHFQYSSVLPQTYLTFVSVLQGIAFSVLLLKIPFPQGDSWSGLASFLLQQYLYLPYIISSLMILVIWSQFVHVCLFLTWPFSVFQTTLIFLLSLVEVLAFNAVGKLAVWFLCIGLVGLIGGIIRLNNLQFLTKQDVDWERSAQKAASIYRASQKHDGIVYTLSGSIVVVFGLMYTPLMKALAPLAPLFASAIPWSILVLLLSEMGLVLFRDSRFRRSFLLQLTEASELVVSSRGIVRYRR